MAVLALALLGAAHTPAYAQDACVPCCAGTGGVGGGAAGGGGTAGHPDGGLSVGELTLNRRVLALGQTLDAEVTFTNGAQTPLVLAEIRIAARAPGASHAGGPYTDLAPVLRSVTIPAGGHVTLSAQRVFKANDTRGKWEAYTTYLDTAGVWHDAPSKYFAVVTGGSGAAGGGGNGDGKPAMALGAQSWFVAAWAGTPYFRSGVNWSSAYANGDDIWNPQFLKELEGFSTWRHMDMNAVNWSDVSRWSQRKQPTDPGNAEIYIDSSSDSDTTGLAVEWQIDLCNRAHVSCWFTHPYLADDDYLRQQATLIKAKLDPTATIYIELSNEVWNGLFSAYDQAIEAGVEGGLPGDNQYYQGISHEMYRALQMYEIYEEVFGASAMGTRVIRVFSESGNLDLTTQALRNVYDSSHWNPRGQRIDMIAMAPYIGSGTNGNDEELERWNREVDDTREGDIAYAYDNHVRGYDIPHFGCYEAGMHHTSGADAWARNPAAYDGYQHMFRRFAEVMDLCTLYTLHGTWKSDGAWGLYAQVGQSLSDAPKARAAKDWNAGVTTTQTSVSTWHWVVLALFILLLIVVLLVVARGYYQSGRPKPPPPPPEPPDLPPPAA
jgi:hypothetical protein